MVAASLGLVEDGLDAREAAAFNNERNPTAWLCGNGDISTTGSWPRLMLDPTEEDRLQHKYNGLRDRLLDMSMRNRMLNHRHSPRSRRQLQIVDEMPEEIYRALVGEGALLIVTPLPEPDDNPPDERTEEFLAALEHAKVADTEYLAKLESLESANSADELLSAQAERELRDRLRVHRGLSPRPNRQTITPAEHARALGIDPSIDLQQVNERSNRVGGRLQTLQWPHTLDAILSRSHEQARLAEQETGLSTLFLAFGFLEWYESEQSEKPAHAPLLLPPLGLKRRRIARVRRSIRCRRLPK